MDSKIRSLTKSFTWRVLGIFILMGLAYLVTGNVAQSSLITISFHIIRVILYFFHERLWLKTKWNGKPVFWFYFWLVVLIISFIIIALSSGL